MNVYSHDIIRGEMNVSVESRSRSYNFPAQVERSLGALGPFVKYNPVTDRVGVQISALQGGQSMVTPTAQVETPFGSKAARALALMSDLPFVQSKDGVMVASTGELIGSTTQKVPERNVDTPLQTRAAALKYGNAIGPTSQSIINEQA